MKLVTVASKAHRAQEFQFTFTVSGYVLTNILLLVLGLFFGYFYFRVINYFCFGNVIILVELNFFRLVK